MHYSIKTTDFFEQVYKVCELIPEGRVTSYGAIASYLGAARSSRMVGWAMNASHKHPNVPAHRVVNGSGVLSGAKAFGYPDMMKNLLKEEGVEVKNNTVKEFKTLLWRPSEELL